MIFAIYPLIAAFAASLAFYYARRWLKTPFLLNVLGSVAVFLAVLSLGVSIANSVVPLTAEDSGTASPIIASMEFFGLAGLAYVSGYLLRAYARKAGIFTNVQDKVS